MPSKFALLRQSNQLRNPSASESPSSRSQIHTNYSLPRGRFVATHTHAHHSHHLTRATNTHHTRYMPMLFTFLTHSISINLTEGSLLRVLFFFYTCRVGVASYPKTAFKTC
ncbi:hypothetical protein M758_UG294400 [Ceratodon purpureus]|nr:hypothetical protein M758_UG294400 [Ceratodon purpureus]